MKYRISDLKNFVATSQCPTIMQAAQKLEISQPALSESLKRLESDLGEQVFYRSRTGVQLTPSGRKYLDKAQKIIFALQELDQKEDSLNVFNGRSIRIGCHATVAQYSLPKALSFIKDKAPDYKIELFHDLSRNIQSEIQRGNIDIGIVINPVQIPDIIVKKLSTDTVGVWGHDKLQTADTIVCNLDLFQTQSILKKWKNKPKRVISTHSLELICELLNEKIGLGILPKNAVRLSRYPFKLHSDLPSYQDEIALVYRPEFGKTISEKLVIEALKRAFEN